MSIMTTHRTTVRNAALALALAVGVAGCASGRKDLPAAQLEPVTFQVDVRQGIGGELSGRCMATNPDGSKTALTLVDQEIKAVSLECDFQNTGWGTSSLRYFVEGNEIVVDQIACEATPVPEKDCKELRKRAGFTIICDNALSETKRELRKTVDDDGEYACSVPARPQESGRLSVDAYGR